MDARLLKSIELPALPEVAQRILVATEDEHVSLERIEGIVSKDFALSSSLLKLANSSERQGLSPVSRIETPAFLPAALGSLSDTTSFPQSSPRRSSSLHQMSRFSIKWPEMEGGR
ncbi:MAG: HDOD domain-containing protein [Chloroflexota bacterium]